MHIPGEGSGISDMHTPTLVIVTGGCLPLSLVLRFKMQQKPT